MLKLRAAASCPQSESSLLHGLSTDLVNKLRRSARRQIASAEWPTVVARTASTKDSNHTARRGGATTMGASESSLFSFFFYVLFVYPATNWLLKPGRFSRTKGLTYAISLLVAIAAVKTGLELKEQGPNYYQLMKVGRSATALEIKRSYKKMSLELHPDKNPSATALDDFATLKNAYDVLMDMDAREVYDRFGPEKLKQKVAVIDEYKVLVEVAIFYAAWGIMTWMLTLGKHNANARQWVFTGLLRRPLPVSYTHLTLPTICSV